MTIRHMLYALWTQTHDDTGWLALTNGIAYRRKNGWVYVHIEGLPKPTEQVVGTLPVGFRPSLNAQPYVRTNTGASIITWITSEGSINVGNVPSSATELAGFVAYPV